MAEAVVPRDYQNTVSAQIRVGFPLDDIWTPGSTPFSHPPRLLPLASPRPSD